ncbi:MAG: hypothetical protein KDA44_18425 [Planctomycetales bacterium]|nr:hypothetical protein [Planctomycetales bacterium]
MKSLKAAGISPKRAVDSGRFCAGGVCQFADCGNWRFGAGWAFRPGSTRCA